MLQFPLLLNEKLFLVVLKFLLKPFQLNTVLFHGFLIVGNLFFHGHNLALLLLQVILIDWDHFFLLNRGLPLENLLQRLKLLFFLLQFAFVLLDLLCLENEPFLDGLDLGHQFVGGRVCRLKLSPSVHIHRVLNLL